MEYLHKFYNQIYINLKYYKLVTSENVRRSAAPSVPTSCNKKF